MTRQRSNFNLLTDLLQCLLVGFILIILIAILFARLSWSSAIGQAQRALQANPALVDDLRSYSKLGKEWEAQTNLLEPLEPLV